MNKQPDGVFDKCFPYNVIHAERWNNFFGIKPRPLRLQIERELILSSADKNSKIPILHEYKQRTAGRVAIAPDAPIKQQAWVQEVSPILPDNSVNKPH